VLGIVVVLLIAALGGGAAYANASLSSTYSPQQAVVDYFAAQRRGDVNGMLSNATYLKGDGANAQFFGSDALTKMLSLSQNKAITDVKVIANLAIDSSTSKVTVSMTWAGNQRTHGYTVRKDTSRVHDFFYDSWRVEIPSATVNVSLPNQPGAIEMDGISLPAAGATTAIQAIEGYHSVVMLKTDFYDSASQVVDVADGNARVSFPSKLSTSFSAAAATSIKTAFVSCDSSSDSYCINHTYQVASGRYDAFTGFPGYSEIDAYSSWSFTFSSDPTAGMSLVVAPDPGKLTGSGKCAVTMTVDGRSHYNFSGSWVATLTYQNGTFATAVVYNCTAAQA
jgi:archaellum component FlaF (FlaF/FlaG flagellin family)